MFFFFSNGLGLIGSIAVSAILTLVLLSFCGVL
jgi:energy-converting hydrogenase Eha subunit E